MVTFTMATGKMTRPMDSANILIPTVPNTKASGLTTSSMDKAKKVGQMVHTMTETTNLERRMVSESFCGLTILHTRVNSLTITSTERVSTHGLTVESTMVTGSATKCMERVNSPGLTRENIMEATMMIKNKDGVYSHGQMEENMTASG